MKKNKIAFLVPGLPEGIGGVPTVAEFILKLLKSKENYDVDIYSVAMSSVDAYSIRLLNPASWFRGIQSIQGEISGMKYTHFGTFLAEFEFQRYQPITKLTKIFNQYGLVQIIAGVPSWANIAKKCTVPLCLFTATLIKPERALLLPKLKGTKRIVTSIMTKIVELIEYSAIQRMNVIFCESYYTLEMLKLKTKHDKLVLGFPGIDSKYFTTGIQYNDKGYILSVGRFSDPRKNVRMLFDAYKKAQEKNIALPVLKLVGSIGPVQSDMEYAKALGISGCVEVHAAVTNTQLRDFYQNASLFILPSNEEGLGIVIAEAMACGLPVISTDCGGPSTVILNKVTGLLTNVGDSTAMADAIIVLMRDAVQRKKMGVEGRKRIEHLFSIEAAGKIYLQKYQELLGREKYA
jgi:D-inositol-3-phosphate glycosyltransferase